MAYQDEGEYIVKLCVYIWRGCIVNCIAQEVCSSRWMAGHSRILGGRNAHITRGELNCNPAIIVMAFIYTLSLYGALWLLLLRLDVGTIIVTFTRVLRRKKNTGIYNVRRMPNREIGFRFIYSEKAQKRVLSKTRATAYKRWICNINIVYLMFYICCAR